jgi:alkanesulfonate monooxygenase SsuD/methylene tetrahydromethanopterin reductase-like flavin-dependent oxidoreductase (luciferase family)
VFVTLGGGGRDRPHTGDVRPLAGSPRAIADGLRDLAAAGVEEAILVVSPISERSIRALADVVASVDL